MRKQWMRLDNAALIFPAIRQRRWANAFRVSATLNEPVDPAVLQEAVNDLAPRFPSMYVRLRYGLFWYYLEGLDAPPAVREDYAFPLTLMQKKELRACCLRIMYYENRIAVEFFHALTDGTGGLIYLKTLVARYLSRKHGLEIPPTDGILDWRGKPAPEELEDSFVKHANRYILKDKEPYAQRLTGSSEPNYLYLTTGLIPSDVLLQTAHRCGVTVTVFLSAVMAEAILRLQAERIPLKRRKPVKVTVPVNLRRLYGSRTLRNFVLTLNTGVDPKMGTYTLEELCRTISAQLAAEATPQRMSGRISANVTPQQMWLIKAIPLPLKNIVMRGVYSLRGESKGCINLSNLGVAELPEPMRAWVDRIEFIIGTQRSYPNNCSAVSYGGTTCVNMIRSIRESDLERLFFSRLVELGVPVAIESNETR